MRHVSTIRKIIDQGQRAEALEAIDDLLELGPNNTEALKLKAMIFASQGRFAEEAAVWHRVLSIDREDEAGIEYFLKQQNEDREHFYFTDPIPSGGRRYLAYPRQLFYTAFVGLLGCLGFLSMSRFAPQYPILADVRVLLGAFFILVICPWIAIVFGWARSLKSIILYPQGLIAETRFKKIHLLWKDIETTAITYAGDPYDPELSLVLLTKDHSQTSLIVNLSERSSSLRAKLHFMRELLSYCPQTKFVPLESLRVDAQPSKSF